MTPITKVLDETPLPGSFPLPAIIPGQGVRHHVVPRPKATLKEYHKIDVRHDGRRRSWTFYFTDGSTFRTADPDEAQWLMLQTYPGRVR